MADVTNPTVALPHNLTNLTLADALQVMANFNQLKATDDSHATAINDLDHNNLSATFAARALGAFRAKPNAQQTIANNTWTKVSLQTEDFDVSGWFDPTTNFRYTPQIAGYYRLGGLVCMSITTGAPTVLVALYKNGALDRYLGQGQAQNVVEPGTSIGSSVVVAANGSTDYFELFVYQASGGNYGTSATAFGQSYFAGELIGRT